jgi:hypothetical protein
MSSMKRLRDENVWRMSSVVLDARSANGLLIEAVVLLYGAAHVTAPAAGPRIDSYLESTLY